MAIETVKVPDLGGADDVEVIEIGVSPGDEIAEEDTLLVLESDKASMDVPSPVTGVVKKILVNLGDKISQDTPIVEVETQADVTAEKPDTSEKPETSEPTSQGAEAALAEAETAPPKEENTAGSALSTESTEQPLTLPDLGTGDEVDVIELAVSVGDQVQEGDTLITLEGDKATMDVPSPATGKILSLSVTEGDKVKGGQQVGSIETAVSSSPAAQPVSPPESDQPEVAQNEGTAAESDQPQNAVSVGQSATGLSEQEAPAAEVYAGPVVRQFARELGIDLRNVTGTGAKGRIQKDDVKAYVKAALERMDKGATSSPISGAAGLPSIPDQDFSKFGDIEEIPLGKIVKLTATNMHRVWLNVPAVTQFDDADITEMEAFRKSMKPEAEKRGVKLTPLAFLAKACASVLRDHPVINRSWHSSGEKVIQKHYVHIGMAVATPNGLLVPVIRDVDQKGIFDIAKDIAVLADKAREGKLSPNEMQGGCFSISSLGAIGGKGFTPIVNAPEAAILGVSRASMQPVWNGSEFEPRQLLPLSLSYDHKLVNGADAGEFLTDLVTAIGDIRRLLL